MSSLSRWRITGTFTVVTPMHLGNGEDDEELRLTHTGNSGQRQAAFVAAIAVDDAGVPYLPGSSIKGALRALCVDAGIDSLLQAKLFGAARPESQDGQINTDAGRIEFCNAYLCKRIDASHLPHFSTEKQTALLAHCAIDRDYGTAIDQKLFYEKVVPPGVGFAFEASADGLTQADVAVFLGLLACANEAQHGLRFGGGAAREAGRVAWTPSGDGVQQFDASCVGNWLAALECDSETTPAWWRFARSVRIAPVVPGQSRECLRIPICLEFHTPFLVNDPWPENGKPLDESDIKPRKNHAGTVILPASSMHGALRAQAERILRTVGMAITPGHAVPVHAAGACFKDLATVLFGASGWASIVAVSDFVVANLAVPTTQEFVAIDRFTGGSKHGAKFKARHAECPHLRGTLTVDLPRLRQVTIDAAGTMSHGLEAALGLLALLLRDLDEGDIAFGYGKSKGYGRCKSNSLPSYAQQLAALKLSGTPLQTVLASMRTATITGGALVTAPARGDGPTVGDIDLAPLPKVSATATVSSTGTGFHNPYMFLPVSSPDNPRDWHDYGTLAHSHHSHARYHDNSGGDAPQPVFNGRIVCQLKTTTPIFIGANRIESSSPADIPASVENFMFKGEIALPATSLRGALSALGEALSQSTMRVLEEQSLFYRKLTPQILSRVGKVVTGKIDGKTVWMLEDAHTKNKFGIKKAVQDRLYDFSDQQTDLSVKTKKLHPIVESFTQTQTVERNKDKEKFGQYARLVQGQKMYFDTIGNALDEMAYSKKIWRARIELPNGTAGGGGKSDMKIYGVRSFFEAIDTDLVPFSDKNKRSSCSPAELMFGFVEDGKAKDNRQGKAFMSKVRFGYGMISCNHRNGTKILEKEWVALKILAAPKPPSPALYFRRKSGKIEPAYLSKAELARNPEKFMPQGRKVYLHALRDKEGNVVNLDARGIPCDKLHRSECPPWQSLKSEADAKQKVRVRPIQKGVSFFFEVDFVNLSERELQTLCATLRPDAHYEHKIGMGKPIGLGSVKITPVGLFLIDRSARYRDDALEAPRYHRVWKRAPDAPADNVRNWPAHLSTEASLAPVDGLDPLRLAEHAMKGVPAALRNAIRVSGDPNAVRMPVHYPQLAGLEIETETYEWFMDNDGQGKNFRGPQQALEPTTDKSHAPPVLKRTRRNISKS